MAVITPPRARRAQYPESDGKPLGETDQHRDLMNDLIFALKLFLASIRAYVAGNLFIYYEEGNPKSVVAPDVFVIFGVQQRQRRIYKTWEEGGLLPDVVIELTSKTTRAADQSAKPELYARLGVREYFIFDPYGEYLAPRLQGFRLVNGAYAPIDEYPLRSRVLDLDLREEENALRLYNPFTGERLPNPAEAELARRASEAARKAAQEKLEAAVEARREAEARAAEQAARATAAEAEIARLRALLEQKGE